MGYEQERYEAAERVMTRVHGHLLSVRDRFNLPAIDAGLADENTALITSLDAIVLQNKDAIDAEDVLCGIDNEEAKEAAADKIMLPVERKLDGVEERAVCPFCEAFADDCGDISHGQCDFCEAPLEECFDEHDNEFWDCSNGCKNSAGHYYEVD